MNWLTENGPSPKTRKSSPRLGSSRDSKVCTVTLGCMSGGSKCSVTGLWLGWMRTV